MLAVNGATRGVLSTCGIFVDTLARPSASCAAFLTENGPRNDAFHLRGVHVHDGDCTTHYNISD